jgi:hypothetical protein
MFKFQTDSIEHGNTHRLLLPNLTGYLPLSVQNELDLALSLRQSNFEPSAHFRAGGLLLEFMWNPQAFMIFSQCVREGPSRQLEHYMPGSILLGYPNQVVDDVEEVIPPLFVGKLGPSPFIWWFLVEIFWAGGYIDRDGGRVNNLGRLCFKHVYISFERFFFRQLQQDSTSGTFHKITVFHDGYLQVRCRWPIWEFRTPIFSSSTQHSQIFRAMHQFI